MPATYGILYDKDKRVRVFNNGAPVSASLLQSVYSKYLNYTGDRFTIAANDTLKTWDISLKYADKVIPYEGGTAQGTVPGYLDFDDAHFDVSALTGDKYTVTSTGRVKVNALDTLRPLNIVNATNNEAVLVADNAGTDKIDLTFNNDEVNVYSNGVLTTTKPRALNFDTGFSITEDDTTDIATISLGLAPQTGLLRAGIRDLDIPFGTGLFNLSHNYQDGTVTGGNDNTHGHFRRYTIENTDDSLLGSTANFAQTQLAFSPHLYGKMAISKLDQCRFIMGWADEEPPNGNNVYLADIEGYMLGFQNDTAETEDTQIQNICNAGDATETKVTTGLAMNSTVPFTFELVAEPLATPTPRWGWNVNGGAFTYLTTAQDTPALNSNLMWNFRMEAIGGSTFSIDIYYLFWKQAM